LRAKGDEPKEEPRRRNPFQREKDAKRRLVVGAEKEQKIEPEKSVNGGKDATHAQEQATNNTSESHVLQFAEREEIYAVLHNVLRQGIE
jgi:hypothetical protein